MTWNYDPAQLSTSKLMQVRWLMGDTSTATQQMQDEEINFALSQRGSIYGAAATVCRALSATLSREADTVDKDLRTTLSARASAYSRRANEYEEMASTRSGALPYAGGISIADRRQQIANTDRVPPQYELGMDDNLTIPVGPGTTDVSGDDGEEDVTASLNYREFAASSITVTPGPGIIVLDNDDNNVGIANDLGVPLEIRMPQSPTKVGQTISITDISNTAGALPLTLKNHAGTTTLDVVKFDGGWSPALAWSGSVWRPVG